MGNVIVPQEESELRAAAFHGNSRTIQTLLFIGVSVNSTNANKDTALHLACITNNVDIARILLDHGASLNQENNNHYKPLHCAITTGNLELVHLLEEKGADIKEISFVGSLLHIAAIAGHLHLIKYLLSRGLDPFEIANGNCPIHWAIFHNRYEIFYFLWERDLETYCKDTKFKNLIHRAVSSRNYDMIKIIAEHCEDINQIESTYTPLNLAVVMYPSIEIIKLLLFLGGNTQSIDNQINKFRALFDGYNEIKESHWRTEVHSLYPLHIRKMVKCILMLGLKDTQGQPYHQEVLFYILPKDCLLLLIREAVQASWLQRQK